MTGGARILVVDDERSMQEFLEIFFRSEGFQVVTAGDLESAKMHLEGDEFDVLITDIQMPGGSGLELLRATHEIAPETVKRTGLFADSGKERSIPCRKQN